MPKQALLNGTLEDANDFDGYNELELLKQALENNSWVISESRTERAGYNYIKIVNGGIIDKKEAVIGLNFPSGQKGGCFFILL